MRKGRRPTLFQNAGLRSWGAAALLALASACSLLIDADGTQCVADNDCTVRGEGFAEARCVDRTCRSRWSCVGKVSPPVAMSRLVPVQVSVTDDRMQPIAGGVLARVCARLDPACLNPLTPDQRPDVNGHFDFELPVGQPVVVEIRPEDAANAVTLPGLVFFTPGDVDSQAVRGVQLISPAALSVLTLLTHKESPDPAAGVIVVRAEDCFGADAEGVSFSLGASADNTHPFYFQGGGPSESAGQTDPSGIGGFINVPTGVQSITAMRHADGVTLGVLNLVVRAGTISYAGFGPTALP